MSRLSVSQPLPTTPTLIYYRDVIPITFSSFLGLSLLILHESSLKRRITLELTTYRKVCLPSRTKHENEDIRNDVHPFSMFFFWRND